MVQLVKICFGITVETLELTVAMEEICSMKLIFLLSHKVGTITLRKQDEVY
jgi:hypothetical protein